jgi:hypothetical protein
VKTLDAGARTFQVEAAEGPDDVGTRVAGLAVERGWALGEVTRAAGDLESFFRSVTVTD